MSVIRAFIAVDLPSEVHQRLEQVSQHLRQVFSGLPIRWVPPLSMHLTLKFLGDVSEANLQILKDMLLNETASHFQHELSIGGLGAFPTRQRPRAIWIGVEAPPELQALQAGVENHTMKLGYPREERPFSPHLTMGRVSRSANSQEIHGIGEVLLKEKVGFLGVVHVKEIQLYRSILKPAGAEYTSLFAARLAARLSNYKEVKSGYK